MNYLLDSHVVDWALSDDPRLSAKVRNFLKEAQPGELAISDVSLSELARHLAAGAIRTTLSPEEWLRLATQGLQVLPVTREIALRAAFLKWDAQGQIHRDPCDRHLVATAAEHRLPLLTCDRKIHTLTGVPGFKALW